jgi:hypothetical protein
MSAAQPRSAVGRTTIMCVTEALSSTTMRSPQKFRADPVFRGDYSPPRRWEGQGEELLLSSGWAAPSRPLRPPLQNGRRVFPVYVTRADLIRLLRDGLARIARLACAAGCLIRGRAEWAEQLDEVSAAFDTAKACSDLTAPARSDFYTRQFFEVRRDIAAHRIRARFGMRFSVVNQQIEIDRDAQPHVVNRFSGLTIGAAIASRMRVCLGVDELRFDIPQAVFALVAFALDGASVYELARSGMG